MAQHLRFFFANRQALIIGIIFMCNSLLFGNWVTRIPSIKSAIGLSEGQLGLALLGAPLGSLLIMPIAGWIIAHFQLGRTVWFSSFFHALAVPILALANSFWTLLLALVYFGLTNSVMDISMNAAAATTERSLKKNIMSSCHGMWSIGAMIGSGLGSILVGVQLTTFMHLSVITFPIIILLFGLQPSLSLIKDEGRSSDRIFAVPNKALILLSLMGFCIMLGEGGIADWSGVYMRETLQANAYLTGLAYAGYALLMSVGRFTGDALIPKFGKRTVVVTGGLLAVVGLGSALLIESPIMAILGFSITGLGYSCIIPILFITAANEPGYSSGAGIASVTIIGYSGFLIGPPLIGFLADVYQLSVGLGFIVFCSLLVSLLALTIKFK